MVNECKLQFTDVNLYLSAKSTFNYRQINLDQHSLTVACGYPSLSSVKPCLCLVNFFEFGLKCRKKANNIEFAQEKRFTAFIFKKLFS